MCVCKYVSIYVSMYVSINELENCHKSEDYLQSFHFTAGLGGGGEGDKSLEFSCGISVAKRYFVAGFLEYIGIPHIQSLHIYTPYSLITWSLYN